MFYIQYCLHLSGVYRSFSFKALHPLHVLSLSVHLSLSVIPHPVFVISGLSLRVGDIGVFFLQSKFLAVTHSLSSEPIQ